MSEAKATARPWTAYDRGIGWEVHSGCNGNHTTCISINNNGFRGTMEEPDVRLIVSAVNSHDTALELARAVLALSVIRGDKELELETERLAMRLLEQAGEKS